MQNYFATLLFSSECLSQPALPALRAGVCCHSLRAEGQLLLLLLWVQLSRAQLSRAQLSKAQLSRAQLSRAQLCTAAAAAWPLLLLKPWCSFLGDLFLTLGSHVQVTVWAALLGRSAPWHWDCPWSPWVMSHPLCCPKVPDAFAAHPFVLPSDLHGPGCHR